MNAHVRELNQSHEETDTPIKRSTPVNTILPARAAALQIFSWAIISLEQTFIAEPCERAKGKFHLVFARQLGMTDRGRMDRPPFLRGVENL
jgi:hypothetical protein